MIRGTERVIHNAIDAVVIAMLVQHFPAGNRFLRGNKQRWNGSEADRNGTPRWMLSKCPGQVTLSQDEQQQGKHPENQWVFRKAVEQDRGNQTDAHAAQPSAQRDRQIKNGQLANMNILVMASGS